jgi:hypothetical protein
VIEKYISANFKIASVFDGGSPAVKTAGFEPEGYVPPEIEQFIQNVQPDPRYRYMHTIAMSDGPTYGSNLNGDVFRADELTGLQGQDEADKNPAPYTGQQIPRYKTFETAKFFHHHDNSPESPAYGDVPLAAWNEPMQRVELIVRIFVDRDPRSAQQLDAGGTIPVSMGCRIAHEKCMYCGHENEFTFQRCDHLKNHMNEIMPDGRLVAADNFKPRFFDISKVTIPADPIALSLGKVASAMPIPPKKRADKDVFQTPKSSSWRQKWSEIEKELPAGGAQISDLRPDEDSGSAPTSDDTPSFSADDMKVMLSEANNDMNQIVSTLTASGVVLSPVEFAHLVLEATKADDSSAEEKDAEVLAPTRLSLDNFSHALYHALQQKIAARSGFVVRGPATGWESTKIAGPELVSDLYAYYRSLLGSLTVDHFIKSATINQTLRSLTGSPVDHDRVKSAMYHLAFAGISTAR